MGMKTFFQIFTLTVFLFNSLQSVAGLPVTLNLVSTAKPAIYSMKGPFRYSNLYFTISPDTRIVGPVYSSDENDALYVQHTFAVALQQAHEAAKDLYVPGGDNSAYYTFLVLALAVPHHESHLHHFREAKSKDCNQENNQLTSLHRPEVRVKMEPVYRKSKKPIFPNCQAIKNQDEVNQVIFSGNKDDVGIMQINPYFHTTTVMPNYYLNLYMTFDYGFNYLRKMFDSIYLESGTKYAECLSTSRPFKIQGTKTEADLLKKINRKLNVISGTWASYNQGNNLVPSVCRLNSNHLNDQRFTETLSAITSHSTSLYSRYLAKSREGDAFREVLNNFFNPSNEMRKHIERVLELDYTTDPQNPTPKRNAYLKSGFIKLYSHADNKYFCGVLDNTKNSIGHIYVSKSENGWSHFQLPTNSFVIASNQHNICNLESFYITSESFSRTVTDFKIAANKTNSTLRVVDTPQGESWVGVVMPKSKVMILDNKIEDSKKWIQIELESGVKGWVTEEKLGL